MTMTPAELPGNTAQAQFPTSETREQYTDAALPGFVIVDRRGGFIAWSDCLMAAIDRYNADKHRDDAFAAHRLVRCRDGVLIKFRPKAGKRTSYYEEAQPVPLAPEVAA